MSWRMKGKLAYWWINIKVKNRKTRLFLPPFYSPPHGVLAFRQSVKFIKENSYFFSFNLIILLFGFIPFSNLLAVKFVSWTFLNLKNKLLDNNRLWQNVVERIVNNNYLKQKNDIKWKASLNKELPVCSPLKQLFI